MRRHIDVRPGMRAHSQTAQFANAAFGNIHQHFALKRGVAGESDGLLTQPDADIKNLFEL